MEGGERLEVELEDEDGRYHRQSLISWWDQDRLSGATVLVVGAGALGNELVKNLALVGVGRVVVVDMDVIENSNLSRCVFFRVEDEGRFKAEVLAERVAEVNPDVEAIPVVGDVRLAIGLGCFREFDVVLGGLDNREARLHISQACWKTGTPLVDGAIEGLLGMMRVFLAPDSACYECTMSQRDHELIAHRRTCALLSRDDMLDGKVPTTATSSSVIAGMQVQEAIKLLHRDRVAYDFGGKGFAFNGLTHDSYVVTYPRKDDCLSHDSYDFESAISVGSSPSFGDMLSRAAESLGDGAVLDLELELVVAATCGDCAVTEQVLRPLPGLKVGDMDCPTCGGGRKLDVTHTVSAESVNLLDADPASLLAPFDVVSGRLGMDRVHFLIGEGDPVAGLTTAKSSSN